MHCARSCMQFNLNYMLAHATYVSSLATPLYLPSSIWSGPVLYTSPQLGKDCNLPIQLHAGMHGSCCQCSYSSICTFIDFLDHTQLQLWLPFQLSLPPFPCIHFPCNPSSSTYPQYLHVHTHISSHPNYLAHIQYMHAPSCNSSPTPLWIKAYSSNMDVQYNYIYIYI